MIIIKNILILSLALVMALNFSSAKEKLSSELPDSPEIKQYNSVSNFYPNPLSQRFGKIDILVHKEATVSLRLYNIKTKLISSSCNGEFSLKIVGKEKEYTSDKNILPKGHYQAEMTFGSGLSSGTYILIIEIGSEVFSRKILYKR